MNRVIHITDDAFDSLMICSTDDLLSLVSLVFHSLFSALLLNMSYNRSYASIVFVVIAVHLILCDKELDGQTAQGSVDDKEKQKNTTNDSRVQDESVRRSLFSSLPVPTFMQSESIKKSSKTKSRKKVKKNKYKKEEEDDEEEDVEQGDVEEQDEDDADDEEKYDNDEVMNSRDKDEEDDEDGEVEQVKFHKKVKPDRRRSPTNVKYVPIPVYM